MKILHFTQSHYSPDTADGVAKSVYFLSREQAGLGHEVVVLYIDRKEEETLNADGVRVISTRWQWHDRHQSILDLLDEIQPDVLHLHSVFIARNIMMARIATKLGIPVVLTPHGGLSPLMRTRRSYLKLPFFWILERPYIRRLAMLHSVGDEASFAASGIHVPTVIGYNGIEPELPALQNLCEAPASLLEKSDTENGRFNILFLGRLDIEQKGLDRLLYGVALFIKRGGKLDLLLAGPSRGDSRQRLEEMVRDHGMGEYVHFLGSVHGKAKWDLMQQADCFVHLSRWEGMSLTVLEALAFNKVLLLSSAADPAGLIARHQAGMVLSDPTPSLVADALQQIATLSDEQREALKCKVRKLVGENFVWRETAERVIEGYRRQCGGKK